MVSGTSITSRQRRAFTLIESLMATVIIAIVASAVLLPFNAAVQAKAYSAVLTRSKTSAEELMEVVLAMPFEDPDNDTDRTVGPDSGESNWRLFDNLDDWHGYTDTITQTGQQTLTRTVKVGYRSITGQVLSASTQVCEIVVTVTDSNGQPLQKLSRLVYAELEI